MDRQVELTTDEKRLIEKAAQQAGMTVEQYLQKASQEFLQQRLGKPKQKYN